VAPAKEYFVSWDCPADQANGDNDKFGQLTTDRPVLQAQLGRWAVLKAPITTVSERTHNLIPAEQGSLAFPLAADNRQVQATANLPWVPNWAFESGTAPWVTQGSNMSRICNDGTTGPCYIFVTPTTARQVQPSVIKQSFKIPSTTTFGKYSPDPTRTTMSSDISGAPHGHQQPTILEVVSVP
jgi:hypothetical protein